jgi:tetratricopeptide (TPR) repeat protein
MRFFGVIFLLLALSAVCSAQMDGMKMSGPPPVKLEKGLGPVHHKVTTSNAQAQAFFDQGLAYIYAFNHDEAVRSFQKAAELDPKMAMAYWGVALARGSNYNWTATSDQLKEAFANLQKALAAAPQTSAQDRSYIAALSKRYSSDPNADQTRLAAAYSAAMKDLHTRFPTDDDAATLYAESMMNLHPWQLWRPDGQPAENTVEIVSTLEAVLKRNPNHTGANHYYMHAVEASPHPEKALPSARRMASLAPNAGHLVHMPSHIYIRTGDYFDAATSNANAVKVDDAYIKSWGGPNFYSSMYTNHNVHFLASASSMIGRYNDAKTNAARLADDAIPMIPGMPMLEYFALYPMIVEVRFHHWETIKRMPAPEARFKVLTAYWHFTRGMAMAGTADAKGAAAELAAMRAAASAAPQDTPMGFTVPPAYFAICDSLLAGQAAIAAGDNAKGVELLRAALKGTLALNYDEPPDWDLPIAEFLGPALLKSKQFAEAETVYRDELKRHPNNGRALVGLSEALWEQKKYADATATRSQFQRQWREADTPMTAKDLYR